ncbi:MAG TPA: autotransporter-associated beta strand repeat-containing protein, partial [Gemmataceae bacterium]
NAAGTTFTVNSAGANTFGGAFASPSGIGNLTKSGAGSLTLTNTSTYNGFTHIDNGTLILGVTNALPVTTPLRIGNANANVTSLDLNGFNQAVAGLQANPSATLASNISIFNNSPSGGTSTLTITGGILTFGGAIAPATVTLKDNNGGGSGVVALALTGGTTTFSGAAANNIFTYSGGTTISGTGTLNIDADAKLGTGGLNLNPGGTLQFASAGGVTLGAARTVTLGGGTFDTNGGNDAIASNMTGTSLVKAGVGTLTLTPAAANTYTGQTAIQNGTLVLGNSGALPAGTGLQLGSGANNTTLDVNGQNVTVSALSVIGSGTATILNNGGAAATVTFAGGTSTFTGVLSSGGTNPVNLTVGSGSLTLLKGGLGASATQTVTVNDGGTFGVKVVNPGDVLSLGTLNVGSGAGVSNLSFSLSGNPTTAPIAATNVAGSLAGTARINIANGAPALTAPVTFDLLTSVNPITNLGSFSLGTLPPRVLATLVTTPTSLRLNITAIDTIKWTGASPTNPTFWDVGTVGGDGFTPASGTPNWKQVTGGQVTVYTETSVPGDTVTFDGTATGPKTIDLRTALSPAAVTVDTAGGDYTFTSTTTGGLTGGMSLFKKNAGTLFVTNPTANTYTGGTFVQGGTVQIGGTSPATPGPGSLPLTPAGSAATLSGGGTLAFNLDAPFVLSGFVTDTDGTGVVNVLGNTVTLTNAANNWSTTNVSAGATLQVGDGSSNGSLVGNANNSGVLAFKPGLGGGAYPVNVGGAGGIVRSLGSQVTTLSGNITGGQSVQVNDTSTVILTGPANTFGGGITINPGTTLQVGDGTLSGSLPAASIPNNNGTLAFKPGPDGITFANVIGGTGAVQALANTTILTGVNAYGGTTTVAAGATLQLGDGTTTGAIAGNVTDNGTLVLKPAPGGATYGNAISGSGAVSLVGAGPFTFTTATTYSGGTTVPAGTTFNYGVANALPNAGTLSVDGTVNLNGLNAAIFGLTGAGTINLGSSSATVLTVNGSGTFNGVITGDGNLSKATNNSTQITLGNHNTYTGYTNVQNSDTVNIAVDNALP